MYTAARFNEAQGVLLMQTDGVELYIDSGELYERAVGGEFGTIAPYVAPIPTAEQLAAENNAPILAEIAQIEAKTLRSVRELLLTPSDVAARKYLQDSETDIETLRGKLL